MAAKKVEMQMLRVEDVMRMAHCSERHVREEYKKGRLIGHKPGKLILFYPEDVEKWIKRK